MSSPSDATNRALRYQTLRRFVSPIETVRIQQVCTYYLLYPHTNVLSKVKNEKKLHEHLMKRKPPQMMIVVNTGKYITLD